MTNLERDTLMALKDISKELAKIRTELKRIGNAVNQMVCEEAPIDPDDDVTEDDLPFN